VAGGLSAAKRQFAADNDQETKDQAENAVGLLFQLMAWGVFSECRLPFL
jgi:hypothetical protein